jgi:ribosomal protein S26
MITHSMLAGMTQTPELMLEQSEAVDLSKATLELMAQYDFAPDPKIQAWITFGGCVGLTYGSRIVAIRSRKSQEKKERKPGVAGVYDADGAPNGTTTWRPNEWPIGEQNDNIGSVN